MAESGSGRGGDKNSNVYRSDGLDMQRLDARLGHPGATPPLPPGELRFADCPSNLPSCLGRNHTPTPHFAAEMDSAVWLLWGPRRPSCSVDVGRCNAC